MGTVPSPPYFLNTLSSEMRFSPTRNAYFLKKNQAFRLDQRPLLAGIFKMLIFSMFSYANLHIYESFGYGFECLVDHL